MKLFILSSVKALAVDIYTDAPNRIDSDEIMKRFDEFLFKECECESLFVSFLEHEVVMVLLCTTILCEVLVVALLVMLDVCYMHLFNNMEIEGMLRDRYVIKIIFNANAVGVGGTGRVGMLIGRCVKVEDSSKGR